MFVDRGLRGGKNWFEGVCHDSIAVRLCKNKRCGCACTCAWGVLEAFDIVEYDSMYT